MLQICIVAAAEFADLRKFTQFLGEYTALFQQPAVFFHFFRIVQPYAISFHDIHCLFGNGSLFRRLLQIGQESYAAFIQPFRISPFRQCNCDPSPYFQCIPGIKRFALQQSFLYCPQVLHRP